MTRIHVISLPHTLLTRNYDWCAYTAKVRRLIGMLTSADVDVLVYGPDVADDQVRATATDYVSVVDEADRRSWFGAPEWPVEKVFDRWAQDDPAWVTMNHRAANAIRERWQPGDIVGLIGGLCQQQIITELADLAPLVTEWGIGYSGVIEGTHKVFESYAWMHYIAALRQSDDIHFFDAVIPNCFDPDDFMQSDGPGDYLLYIGRPNPRKGLAIVADVAKYSGMKLVVAGQPGAEFPGANVEYAGIVTGTQKAQLIAGARALLCPTTYLEPFGGVAVEAMMSGVPAIATDYGAFTETISQGETGFRCRILRDFLDAVEQAGSLDRTFIRDWAIANYSIERGSRMYQSYLNRLASLYENGWYQWTALPPAPPTVYDISALAPAEAD